MSSERASWVHGVELRQLAFSVEQMAPGGTERAEPGRLVRADLERALARLDALLADADREEDAVRAATLRQVRRRCLRLMTLLEQGGERPLVYVARQILELEPRLRSAAIEIDFVFGDRDGEVSKGDLKQARFHYGRVRGPVGWNRLLLADEVERRIFPDRTLRRSEGLRLLPAEWMLGAGDPLRRLRNACRFLDDAALARTFADVAARLACADPASDRTPLFEQALGILGGEIQARDSVRPTITDVARVGCQDPEVKASLQSPFEMSRRLSPTRLLDRYLA